MLTPKVTTQPHPESGATFLAARIFSILSFNAFQGIIKRLLSLPGDLWQLVTIHFLGAI